MTAPERLRDATTLRPRRVGEILEAAIVLWGENFRVLTAFAAGLLLPFEVLAVLVGQSAKPSFADAVQSWSDRLNTSLAETPPRIVGPNFRGVTIASFAGSSVIAFLGTYVLTAALTVFIADAHLRRPTDRRRSLRVAWRRGPVMIVSALLWLVIWLAPFAAAIALVTISSSALAVIPMLALYVLGLWLLFRLGAGGPAVVVEHAGPIQALRRSFALTEGRWRAVAGATILAQLMTRIPAGIIAGLINAILSALGGHNAGFEFVWTAVAQTVAAALTAPVSAAVAVILYFELPVRHEGFDLEQLAATTLHA